MTGRRVRPHEAPNRDVLVPGVPTPRVLRAAIRSAEVRRARVRGAVIRSAGTRPRPSVSRRTARSRASRSGRGLHSVPGIPPRPNHPDPNPTQRLAVAQRPRAQHRPTTRVRGVEPLVNEPPVSGLLVTELTRPAAGGNSRASAPHAMAASTLAVRMSNASVRRGARRRRIRARAPRRGRSSAARRASNSTVSRQPTPRRPTRRRQQISTGTSPRRDRTVRPSTRPPAPAISAENSAQSAVQRTPSTSQSPSNRAAPSTSDGQSIACSSAPSLTTLTSRHSTSKAAAT